MNNKSFFGVEPEKRFMLGNLFFLFLIQGLFVIMIGSILPMMKEAYNLSYEVGGLLISAHNVGNVLAGFLAGLLPLLIGMKSSVIFVNALVFIGFFITLITGNPIFLIIALFLTGLGRGGITNYDNQIVSTISSDSAGPLNALHGFFAIGAVIAPILTMFFTRNGNAGWRYSVYTIIGFGVISTITSCIMKVDNSKEKKEKEKASFDFIKEKPFYYTMMLMFFYQAVEASIMGWLVTYYMDSGVIEGKSTQILTSLLWVVILIGRFACMSLSMKIAANRITKVLSLGVVVFLAVLIFGNNLAVMLIGTVGLGLSFSGLYGTITSNASEVFKKYPLAMGTYIFLSGIGAIITPSIVGVVSGGFGVQMGMTVLFIPAILLFIMSVFLKTKAD